MAVYARLPGLGQFCRQIKAERVLMDILVVLLADEPALASELHSPAEKDVEEIIAKPFRETELAARIRTLLNLRDARLALRASNQQSRRLLEGEIAGRKEAERAESKYRGIFENATEGIFQTTPQGRYLNANPALARMFGYDSPGELIAAIHDLAAQTYVVPQKRDELKRLLETQDSVQAFEVERFRKDGRRFWISINGHAVRDAAGAILYYEGTNQDITARKFAETVLRQSEQKFRSFFEFAPIGVALHNAEGKYLQANHAYQRMLGYTEEELRHLGVRRITHAEDIAEAQQLFRELCDGKRDHYRREKRYWSKDGRLVWAHSSASAVRDESGHLRYIISMVEDITEAKRTEEALVKTQKLQKAILDNIPDPAWLKDADGRFLACNQQLAQLFGQTADRVLGKTISDFILWEADRFTHRDTAVLESSKPVSSEERLVDAQGKVRWFETIRTPVQDEFGAVRGITGIARDVTERKWVESLLQVQRDFGTFLGATNDLRAAVERLLKIALQSEGIECGAVYLVDDKTGEMNLAGQQGLSIGFVRRASHFGMPAAQLELPNHQQSVPSPQQGPMSRVVEQLKAEGLRAMELIPIQNAGRVVAVLNLGSRGLSEIPIRSRQAIEAIAAQAGGAIARIRAEQSLRANRQLLEKTLHSLRAAVFVLDAETSVVLECNPAASQIFGYAREELIGQAIDFLHLEGTKFAQLRKRISAEARTNASLSSFELKMRRKNGSAFPTENSLTPIKDEMGETVSWVSVVRDLTDLKRAEEDLRELSLRIIEAQETERLRVARELHDGVNQVIASAKMRLAKVASLTSSLSPAAREILARCNELLVQALEENRRIAYNLRPSDLDDLGLAIACRNFCKDVRSRTKLELQCSISPLLARLPPAMELNLFRIAQEAVSNVEKHAQAKTARLQISIHGKSILLQIQDDGRGFSARKKPRKGKWRGIGLTNIKERAASLGGTCAVKSAPKQGTAITVQVPLENGG